MKLKKNKERIRRLVYASLFAALTCVLTLIVQIPTPTKGYMNLGDAMVLLSGWLLGPFYGVFAAAIGSMLADMFTGYFLYAPATFVIKGAVALIGYLVSRPLKAKVKKYKTFSYILSGICAEAVMVCGYLVFEATVAGYGFAGALIGVPNNLMQAVLGIVIGVLLITVMEETHLAERIHISDHTQMN